MYHGQDFLNEWDFFAGNDPTNGLVEYLSKDQASHLAYVQKDGTTVLAVDSTTKLAVGQKRNSVRISSKKSYTGGLFIADFFAMPHGCSVWPAYWSVGPNWPSGGEIDVIEGVNNQSTNQYALHTSQGCTLPQSVKTTSQQLGTQCATINGDNTGCRFLDSDERSYGHQFNEAAGGVYAHLWNSDGIKIWFFSRGDIPADITAKQPNPTKWGDPAANWASTSCNIDDHFYSHTLQLDTTLCGDWAGSAYASSGCPGTCAERVADPSNFLYAKWMLNYIAVYNN